MYYYEPPSEKNWFTAGILKKIIICIVIIIFILLIKKIDLPIANDAFTKIKYVVFDYSYEFEDIMEVMRKLSISKDFPVFSEKKSETMLMPVQGEISSNFGMRLHPILKQYRMHNGIDITQKEGTPVKVVLDGVVSSVGSDPELGNVVRIKHDNELETLYAHLRDVYVKEQEKVAKGFIIGTVGKTGLAETAHLHFEVWLKGKPEDPNKWIKPEELPQEEFDGFKNI